MHCEIVLVTNVPHAEQGSGNEGDHHDDHDPLDVEGVPDVRTPGGDGCGDTEEGVKGIPCRMQPS